MKLKDKQTLKQKDLKALKLELQKAKLELNSLRLDFKTNKIKDVKKLSRQRYKIAVIKTFINQIPL